MAAAQEMTIPTRRRDRIFALAVDTFVTLFVLVAIVNICHGVALAASCFWIVLVAICVRQNSTLEGGFRRYLVNRLGELVRRHFVEADPPDVHPRQIRFGYGLFGRRFIQQTLAVDAIESVDWSAGQATALAGRDMKDWQVCLWFDHNDPTKSQSRQFLRKPDQEIYIVGLATCKETTETFGLALVVFLRGVGAPLVPGADATRFVRKSAAGDEVA